MADNEKYIDDTNTGEIETDIDTSTQIPPSRKRVKKTDDSIEISDVKLIKNDKKTVKTTKPRPKSKIGNRPSDMLKKIENRIPIHPPIKTPRVKKNARKKTVKVNTKTINRVVRFF